jgi:RHS repeat-associated protein
MAASEAMVAAGEHLSSSRPVRRAKTRPAARIPLCVEPPTPFAEGPGPSRDWWEKALSEKSFRAGKHENSQQNQGVGANSRTTTFGPFGEVIRATGPMAFVNPFRFSTEYYDDETGIIMYPYRPYSPSTGRFLSRDPLGSPGFDGNQYFAFSKNDLRYLAALDPGDENLDALETAQNNIFYTAGKTTYVVANNDAVDNTDLYGLVCDVVANRTKALMSSGINAGHEWIVYGGNSVGFWPNRGYVVLRPDPAAQAGVPIYWQWETVQKKSGTIKWGSGAGKSCACATCADILASIDAAPNPGWHSFPIRNNCRRFVQWVFAGSCLEKGKKTSLNP